MIALAGLVVLLFILPALVFCTNINRWLTKTHNNIVRLSRGEMNIDRNDAFYSRELIAISDAIQQLRQYQLDKVSLESEKQLLIKELRPLPSSIRSPIFITAVNSSLNVSCWVTAAILKPFADRYRQLQTAQRQLWPRRG